MTSNMNSSARHKIWWVSTPFHVQTLCLYGIAFLLAYGLKLHYSRAGSVELTWILWPTARLVSWVSGFEFVQESGTGYVNYGRGIIIAPACAGVNFLIAAWCMAIFSFLHRFRRGARQWLWFGGCAIGTYGLTILANAVRIVVAIVLYRSNLQFGWLTPERLHRLEGILVYFSALCLYSGFLKTLCRPSKQRSSHVFVPVFWYVSIILAIPLLRLAYLRDFPRFLEHSAFVVSGCAFVLICCKTVSWLWRSCGCST